MNVTDEMVAAARQAYWDECEVTTGKVGMRLALDAAIALMRGQSCVWTIDADPYAEMWNGACGIAWTFTEGGPADNECNHCPKCGGRIEATEQPKDPADEQ